MSRLRLLVLVLPVLLLGCSPKEQQPRIVVLAEGTEVPLILLQQLEAGKAHEGDEVALMVSEDVMVNGDVAIAKGTLAKGKVTWSRSEGSLSALANQPARLAISLDETTAVGGSTVMLTADAEDADEPAFQFTRANTGRIEMDRKLDELWESESAQKLLTEIHNAFEGEGDLNFDDEETRKNLENLAKELNLKNLTDMVDQGKTEEVEEILRTVRRGDSLTRLMGSTPLATIGAAIELANVAGEVGAKLGRMLKGRTIRAYIGTPVTAHIAEDHTLQIPQK